MDSLYLAIYDLVTGLLPTAVATTYDDEIVLIVIVITFGLMYKLFKAILKAIGIK